MRMFAGMCAFALVLSLFAADAEIKLVKPDTTGGKPLMQAIAERRSMRNFAATPLTEQQLSDIFFAAHGLTGKKGRRTTPTARNVLDMEIFAATPQGLYRYDAETHSLKLVLDKDIRKSCGRQGFHAKAPLDLIYVSDYDKYKASGMSEANADFYAPNHAGYISQNVYLYAASAGLVTVVCNNVDKPALARAMKLGPQYRIMLTQPVGNPAK